MTWILILVGIAAASTVVLTLLGLRGLLQAVPVVDRNYQDPLPPVLRLLWPLVQAATQLVGPRLSAAQLETAHKRLQAAGQDYVLSPEELYGTRVVTALGIKREQLNVEKEYKGAGGVIDRAYQTGARGGRTTKKEVTNADIKSFITEFGDKPSYEKDPKTGKPIAIRDLPLAKQAAYANEFYLGREAPGGLPDVPEGGLKLEKPGAKKSQPASTALPRSFEGQKFGMLTPRSVVLEAAQAGNPDAIAFLEGMEKNRLDQELQRGNLGL